MKPEPSEVKTDQSIKTDFNFKSQRLSNKWRRLYKRSQRKEQRNENKVFFFLQLTKLT